MPGPETAWIRANASRMDPELRARLVASYRPPRWTPCWFAPRVVSARQRFERIPVIIQTTAECPQEARIRMVGELRRHRCRHVRDLSIVRSVAAEVPVDHVPELLSDPRVDRVTYDRAVHALLDVAAPTVFAPEQWEGGLMGEGVTVAVIDTGIHPHSDFTTPENRIVGFRDFVSGRADPYDDNGHGTHVAGIVGGNGSASGGQYKGLAPEAGLVGVKVLNALGAGSLSTVIEGIQWSMENREAFGIRILNLSLGSRAQESYRDDPVAQAAGVAWDAGLVVCAAAGNDGPQPRTIATPGIHPSIITVGASDDRATPARDDDAIAAFSSRGPTIDDLQKPDLVAPGVEITAANAPKSVLALQQGNKKGDYITLSGTSMATPVCAGIAALVLQREPGLTPDGVKERLVSSGESLGEDANTEGSGLVSARTAVSGSEARAV